MKWSPGCDTWTGSFHSVDLSDPTVKQGSCLLPCIPGAQELPIRACILGPAQGLTTPG